MRISLDGAHFLRTLCAGLIGAVLAGTSIGVQAHTGRPLAKQAIISPKHAEAIAKNAYPGRIFLKGIKRGHDGKDMHYSFAIVNHGTVHEVVVDARNGKVLKNYKVSKIPKRPPSQHPKKAPARHHNTIPHTTV